MSSNIKENSKANEDLSIDSASEIDLDQSISSYAESGSKTGTKTKQLVSEVAD